MSSARSTPQDNTGVEGGRVALVGEVTPDSTDVAPLGVSRYDLTIPEPAVAQRARELQRIVMESEETEAEKAQQQLHKLRYRVPNQ